MICGFLFSSQYLNANKRIACHKSFVSFCIENCHWLYIICIFFKKWRTHLHWTACTLINNNSYCNPSVLSIYHSSGITEIKSPYCDQQYSLGSLTWKELKYTLAIISSDIIYGKLRRLKHLFTVGYNYYCSQYHNLPLQILSETIYTSSHGTKLSCKYLSHYPDYCYWKYKSLKCFFTVKLISNIIWVWELLPSKVGGGSAKMQGLAGRFSWQPY